jgi:hypothetical protein
MRKTLAALISAAIMVAMAPAASNAGEARRAGDWGWAGGAFASPHYYYVPFYFAPYGFRYVGNPDYPGCYFARRAGPRGSYVVPVC